LYRLSGPVRSYREGMRSTPLASAKEVYRPFTAAESDLLRGFVASVRRLGRMRFFEQLPKTATQHWDDEGMRGEMKEPDDEAVQAPISAFRPIYKGSEPQSAAAILNLLKRSVRAHDGAKREDALAAIADLGEWRKSALNAGIGLGIRFEYPTRQERVDPATILDAYFHGQYLHSANDKSKLVRRLDDLDPWPRYTLYTVMGRLMRVYWVIANVVELILKEPSLLDGPGPAIDQAARLA
jgi:hypothetical protein